MTNRAQYSPSIRRISSPLRRLYGSFSPPQPGSRIVAVFLHNGIIGGGDGKWYAAVVADVVGAMAFGAVAKFFVGQTRFAAMGTVIPIRVAPYLQHLTVAIDFATFHTLAPYLLLNLAVVISGAAGGVSAYLCLRSIIPSCAGEEAPVSVGRSCTFGVRWE